MAPMREMFSVMPGDPHALLDRRGLSWRCPEVPTEAPDLGAQRAGASATALEIVEGQMRLRFIISLKSS